MGTFRWSCWAGALAMRDDMAPNSQPLELVKKRGDHLIRRHEQASKHLAGSAATVN